MNTTIEQDIDCNVTYCLIKGEIEIYCENPWIRAFLQYIIDNPHANETDICRDLFIDNGPARKAAVKNILFFFECNGLIKSNRESGRTLTKEGFTAFETANIWQGQKGTFQMVLWQPNENYHPFILNIQTVPDEWYDNGKNELKNFPNEYGTALENLTMCNNKIRIKSVENIYRQNFVKTDFDAKIKLTINPNKFDNRIKIDATPQAKGLKSYNLNFKLDKDIFLEIFGDEIFGDDDDDEDED